MFKFIIPAIIIFCIVLFWEKINKKIYEKYNIKITNIISVIILLVLVIVYALLYF
jgi:hypothetical protein